MGIHWAPIPLKSESIRLAQLTYGFKDTLKKNMTDKFFDELKIIAISNANLIMDSFGPPGSGKSYQNQYIIEKLAGYKNQELKIGNVWFTITEALEGIEKMEKGGIGTIDEQIATWGRGSKVERSLLNNIEMTVRAHKLSLFFLSPVHVMHNYHYYLQTWQVGSLDKWDINKPMEEQWRFTKSIIYDYMNQPLGYIITDTPKNKEFLKQYEKKKDKFIFDVRKRRGSGRHAYVMEKAYKMLKDKNFFEAYMQMSKNNRLKRLAIKGAGLKWEQMVEEEVKDLISYTDYILAREPKYIKMVKKWKSENSE